jgi:ABC-2 type transport system permease protein
MLTRWAGAARSIDVRYYPGNADEIRSLIYSRKACAALYIPRNFEADLKKGSAARVRLFVNGTNLLAANLIQSDIRTAAGTLSAGVKLKYLEKSGNPPQKAMALQSQLKVDVMRLYNPAFNYMGFLVPGMWFAVLYQIFMVFGALSIAQEKDKNTFRGLFEISGKSAAKIMAGKYSAYTALAIFLSTVYLAVFYPAFGLEIKGSTALLSAFTLLFILAVISLGFFISCVFKDRNDAVKGTLLLAAPAFILSGYTWPLDNMPWYIKPVALAIPLTEFLSGVKKIVFYGAGAESLAVEASALAAMAALYSGLALFFLDKAVKNERLL